MAREGGEGHVSRSFGASVAVRSITARPKLAASRHSGRVRVDGARSPPALLVPGRPPRTKPTACCLGACAEREMPAPSSFNNDRRCRLRGCGVVRDVPPRGCGTAQPYSRTEAPSRASGTGARRAAYASRRRTTRSRIWSRATLPRHRPPGTAPAPGARRGGNRAPSSRPAVALRPLARVCVPTP